MKPKRKKRRRPKAWLMVAKHGTSKSRGLFFTKQAAMRHVEWYMPSGWTAEISPLYLLDDATT